jgi:hypothetical protein
MFKPGQRGPGRGGLRKKAPLKLPALVVPDGIELAEYACPVRECSELVGCSFQNLHARIEAGSLPAFLHEGQKFVRIEDLAASAAADKQRDADHVIEMRRAWHDIRRDTPISSEPLEDRCVGEWEDCQICGPITDEWDRLGEEPAPPVERPKRTYSPGRLAQLARARERAHAVNAEKNAARARMRAADIAAVRARLGSADEA